MNGPPWFIRTTQRPPSVRAGVDVMGEVGSRVSGNVGWGGHGPVVGHLAFGSHDWLWGVGEWGVGDDGDGAIGVARHVRGGGGA